MAHDLSGKRVAILATDGVERVELEQPRGALYGAGADTELLSIHPGEIQARQFDLVSAGTFSVDKLVTDAPSDDYPQRDERGLGEEREQALHGQRGTEDAPRPTRRCIVSAAAAAPHPQSS